MSLTIGEVVARSGLTHDTLRFYEREGLVPAPHRNSGNHRRYPEAVLEQLEVIRTLRAAGVGLEQIRALLAVKRPGTTAAERIAGAAHALRAMDADLARRAAEVAAGSALVAAYLAELDAATQTGATPAGDPWDRPLDC